MLVSELKTVDLTIFIFLSVFLFYFLIFIFIFWYLGLEISMISHIQKMLLSSYHHLVWLALIGNSSVLCVHYILSLLQQVKYEIETFE